jgi:hypothetical protein
MAAAKARHIVASAKACQDYQEKSTSNQYINMFYNKQLTRIHKKKQRIYKQKQNSNQYS